MVLLDAIVKRKPQIEVHALKAVYSPDVIVRVQDTGECIRARKAAPPASAGNSKRTQRVVKFLPGGQSDEKRLVIGVVLIPDQVDAQGDAVPADVIEDTAIDFGVRLNQAPIGIDLGEGVGATQVGVMHESFVHKDDLRVAFNWVTPVEIPAGVLGTDAIPVGAWIVVTKVFNDSVWQDVKDGKLTGYSMGGEVTAIRTDKGVEIAKAAAEQGVDYYLKATLAVMTDRLASQAPGTPVEQSASQAA